MNEVNMLSNAFRLAFQISPYITVKTRLSRIIYGKIPFIFGTEVVVLWQKIVLEQSRSRLVPVVRLTAVRRIMISLIRL